MWCVVVNHEFIRDVVMERYLEVHLRFTTQIIPEYLKHPHRKNECGVIREMEPPATTHEYLSISKPKFLRGYDRVAVLRKNPSPLLAPLNVIPALCSIMCGAYRGAWGVI